MISKYGIFPVRKGVHAADEFSIAGGRQQASWHWGLEFLPHDIISIEHRD